jgi:hypothetical protein
MFIARQTGMRPTEFITRDWQPTAASYEKRDAKHLYYHCLPCACTIANGMLCTLKEMEISPMIAWDIWMSRI